MKTKLFAIIPVLTSIFICLTAGAAEAATSPTYDVTVTYTADNYVNNWWLKNDSGVELLSAGENRDDWKVADTETFQLDAYQTHELIWEVFNFSGPGGFLGQIDSDATGWPGTYPSSAEWFVAIQNPDFSGLNFDVLNWEAASEYGRNDEGSTVWYDANGGPVAGIAGNAEWIWTDKNDPPSSIHNYAFVKGVLHAVPIPGAVWLLGTGLASLLVIRRKGKSIQLF